MNNDNDDNRNVNSFPSQYLRFLEVLIFFNLVKIKLEKIPLKILTIFYTNRI
jgi:hypothetical protein